MLSERLKKLREKKEVLQKDVANYIGVSERVYGFYETGRFPKDEIILTRLADYFNCTVDYLIGRTNDPEDKVLNKNDLPIEWVKAGIESLVVFKDLTAKDLNR